MRDWQRAVASGVISTLLCSCATKSPAPNGESSYGDTELTQIGPHSKANSDLVIAAMSHLDRPYQAGGQSIDTGFDCSGFTRHVFGQMGIELPRSAQEQARAPLLRSVTRDALQAGDLVFFNTQRRAFSHVGIYVGGGRFIHAPRTGAQIRTESLSAEYWARRYDGARRAVALAAAHP